jgi:hypothetical protein
VAGVEVASGNDGPVDREVVGTAVHRISASDLLVTVAATPLQPSVGAPVDVAVLVRNRGTTPLDPVVPRPLALVPPLAATLVSGPAPAQLALAPGASDTLHYRYRFDAAGTTTFVAVVSTADSATVAEPAASPVLDVRHVATALALEPRSNLPAAVSRGQAPTTPVIWKLTHTDADPQAGAILVHSLRVAVETAAGAPQPAADVFARLEIRSGGVVRTLVESVPDTSVLDLVLVPPLVLAAGEVLDVPLQAAIAADAAASFFQLRLAGPDAVRATDAGSGTAVPLAAALPWTTPATPIRTIATSTDVAFLRTLPAGVNRGQNDVDLGSLRFALPGAPGESEARVVRLAAAIQDSAGAALDPRLVFDRVEAWSGASRLLAVDNPSAADGMLLLPLTIPLVFTAGAPEEIALRADVRDDVTPPGFAVTIASAADLVIQDGTTGAPVQAVPVAPDSFPALLGTAHVVEAARTLVVDATSRLPTTAAAGATLPVADLVLRHPDPAGTAAVRVDALHVRITDPQGAMVPPRSALAALELRLGGAILAGATALPATADPVALVLTVPAAIAAGESATVSLHATLSGAPTVTAFRFALEGAALDLVDANDPAQTVLPTGTLPFATGTLQVTTAPVAVQLGVTADPPANLVRGQTGAAALAIEIRHPGTAGEAALRAATLVLHLEDLGGTPLPAADRFAAATLRAGASTSAAAIAGDSLAFDLASWPPLEPGAPVGAVLEVDVRGNAPLGDFRFAVGQQALVASAGPSPVPVQPLPGRTLPYRSPSVHLSPAELASSFTNYPNPFAAGREATHIPFYLAAAARVTVEVCTLTGERIVRLLDGARLDPGLHDDLSWDGRNGRGEIVRNGTYVLCIDVEGPGGGKLRRKVAVVR